jgi:hypothetical protein
MKIYVNRNLMDIRGDLIKDSLQKDAKYTKLGELMAESLLQTVKGDEGGGPGLKIMRYNMAKKIRIAMEKDTTPACELDMRAEDVGMIKIRLDLLIATPLLGPVFEAIEDNEVSERYNAAVAKSREQPVATA